MKARIKWVEDRTFVAESGSGHAVVLGTSTGLDGRRVAPSAMEYVLMGTGGPDSADAEPPEPPFIMTLLNSEPVLRWRWAVPPTGVALMRAGSDMAFSGGPQPDWWLEGLRANFERWGTLMAYTGEMRGVAGASIDATFDPESLLQPVLILHGDDDWAAPVEIGRYLHTVIPRSELIEIEGGSHMLPVTHAAELADRIAAFAAAFGT